MKIKLLLFLILIGFFYRIYGLSENYSFWTDENHVAIFVRAIMERGEPILINKFSTDAYQWLFYWFGAISSKIFGISEFAIRLPSVFFGVSTILVIYLLGKEIFNRNVGLLNAFFVTFLNIEILFSRQARPYQALQFFYLLGIYFIYKLIKEKKFNWRYFLGFLGCGIFASLMHGLGLVIFFTGFMCLLVFSIKSLNKKWMLLGVLVFLVLGFVFKVPISSVFSQIGKTNNLFYYRIFLTQNYLTFCLLSIIGGLTILLQKRYREFLLFVFVLLIQLLIVSFFLHQHFTRYIYPIFGFIIILASYGMMEIGNKILEIGKNIHYPRLQKLLALAKCGQVVSSIIVILVVLSLVQTNKLSLLPNKIYSLNADMQEIPEVDWKKIYGFVGDKRKQNPKSVLITNWSDLPLWYLGEGSLDYVLRKDKTTVVESFSGAIIVSNIENFEKIVNEYPSGLLILDSWDDQIPDGIQEYSRNNLKKELEIDQLYPTQPRYWPVSVYSWGVL